MTRAVIGAVSAAAALAFGAAVVAPAAPANETSPAATGQIIFARALHRDGPSNLYLVNADGTGLRLLVKNAGVPAASSTGTLAFVRGKSIWLSGRDGSKQRQLTHPPASSGGDSEPAWSPDGRHIYFTRADGSSDTSLYVVMQDGRTLRRIHYARPTNHVDCDARPAVSPDGRSIAFANTGDCEHGDFRIIAVNSDGHRVRLPFRWPSDDGHELIEFDPAWSRDGRLAYGTVDVDAQSTPPFGAGGGGLYVSQPDGSRPQRLAKSGSAYYPAWSPDGKWLAYTDFDSGRLYVVAATDGRRYRLVALRGYLTYATWLP